MLYQTFPRLSKLAGGPHYFLFHTQLALRNGLQARQLAWWVLFSARSREQTCSKDPRWRWSEWLTLHLGYDCHAALALIRNVLTRYRATAARPYAVSLPGRLYPVLRLDRRPDRPGRVPILLQRRLHKRSKSCAAPCILYNPPARPQHQAYTKAGSAR